MKHKVITLATLALIAVMLAVSPVLAYVYRATYTVTSENTTDFTMLGVSTDNGVNNQWMADNGYMGSTANDTRIETLGGLEQPHMITDNATFTAIPVSAGSQTNLYFTTGNSERDFDIIPGYGGLVNVTDEASLEPGGNFTSEQSGWWDTDAGYGKYAVRKQGAFSTFVSPAVAENITSEAGVGGLDFVRANSDWVSIPDHNDFSFVTGGVDEPFSIVVWANLDDATTSRLVSKWTALKDEWTLVSSGTDKLSFLVSDSNQVNWIGRETNAVTGYEGDWIHIVATYDGSEIVGGIDIYINGVVADTGDLGGGAYVGMTNDISVVELGSSDGGTAEYLDGMLLDVKVYSAELTPAEALADYYGGHKSSDLVAWYQLDEGTGLPQDTSGNAHHSTANLADWLPIASVTATGVASGEHIVTTTCDGALDFVRANSDWVSIPDHNDFSFTDGAGNDEPVSIVCWVNLDDATSNRLVTKRLLNNNEWSLFSSGTDVVYFLLSNATETSYIARGTAAVTGYEGDWIHIVATYDGSEVVGGIDIYINGAVADTGDLTAGAYAGMARGGAVVELGSTNGGTAEYLDGLLANVKIYDVELTQPEALADYNGGHKSSDLVAWYQLEEGTGNPQDSSGNAHHSTVNLADWVSVLRIYIDDTLEDEDISAAYSVPDNVNVWAFLQNNVMPYADNITITVGGILELWFQPATMIIGTTLPDRATSVANDGTFIWGVNPTGVDVTMGGLVSGAQPSPGLAIDDPTPDIMPGVEVTDWYIEPDVSGVLLTFPLRPFVTILSDTTTLTELQAWRLLGTALLLLVLVSTAKVVRGHHLITGIATGACMLGLVTLTIYPMWALVFAAFAVIAGLISERTPSV